MKQFFATLKTHIQQHPPNFGDSESVRTMLYECHNENNPCNNEQSTAGFIDGIKIGLLLAQKLG